MVFSSSIFLFVFLPVVLLIYYLIRPEFRNPFLLIASLSFYAWANPIYIFVILFAIVANFLFGKAIAKTLKKGKGTRRFILTLGILSNLVPLLYYKYYNFFFTTVNQIAGTDFPMQNHILPLGISFFTFCGIAYLVDIYKRKTEVQNSLVNFSLYLSFFPKVSQGPITRYGDMAGQLENRTCTVEKFSGGIRRFSIGLAKKVLVADVLGQMVDSIYNLPANQNTAAIAWMASIGYTFQIYFDFSGYSDMAIGLGKMFGFDIMENFNYPYISKNISEFWRRWHISLSSWFRDYLYIPLGGNRTGNVYVNLMIVFLVTGLWHGAAWNFIIWGIWHGIFILLERVFRVHKIQIKVPPVFKWLYAMFIVNIGWVLFRAPDLHYALNFLGVMFGVVQPVDVGFTINWYLSGKMLFAFVVAVLASIPWKKVFPCSFSQVEGTYLAVISKNVWAVVLLFFSIMGVMTSTYNSFIYFKF
ncbi:MBOAT family protein [Caproiciproducens galactitolivorans]|uniref:MBOAT family O-acyltransferase n=1 Tax=Caproiciproducens galactitolivorans TaxID=642589 RepID=UPI00240A5847|nr:MBOAT family protein [Caproiciproducens galactitolivorans]